MIRRAFLDHPASVGESYGEHFVVASAVGVTMIAAGLACLVHAAVPSLFASTGSRTIRRLAARVGGVRAAESEARAGWVI